MKKLLLSIVTISVLAFYGNSQITMNIAGQSTDISGGVHIVNLDQNTPELVNTGAIVINVVVHNNTGSSKSWNVTRKKLSVPSTWEDMVCLSNCYNYEPNDIFCTPSNELMTIANSSTGTVQLHYTPDNSYSGSVVYRYYVGDCSTFEDSVDIQLNFALGLKSVKQSSTFSVSPNPANDIVNITNIGNDINSVKIIDVLGNIVYNETITNSKKVDVSDFKNGIYFVSIETSDSKISNRKLIIRH
jgi:hypothetical protein